MTWVATAPLEVSLQGSAGPGARALAEEVHVALVFNGVSHAVMLASPADLEDFALGFSLSERIITGPEQLYDCVVATRPQGLELQLELAAERFALLKARRRSLVGRTGCGLCGLESLDAARPALAPVGDGLRVPMAALTRGLEALGHHQPLHGATHAVHAAAWVDLEGQVRLAREDVGRHNALDKLLGALSRARLPVTQGFALITSRASVEMVQKAVVAGVELLFSLSPPTGLAVETAASAGLTLAGGLHAERFAVHTHPHRLLLQGAP
jgi:formate dehydrogenase accessory protein FdhD